MLDIDKPTARTQYGKDLIVDLALAIIRLVVDGIAGNDRVKRTVRLHSDHPGGMSIIEILKQELALILLELFLRHPKQVLTREVIFDRVWGYDFGGESNVLEVYIRYLRQKLEGEGENRLIHTVRGVGYVLRENP